MFEQRLKEQNSQPTKTDRRRNAEAIHLSITNQLHQEGAVIDSQKSQERGPKCQGKKGRLIDNLNDGHFNPTKQKSSLHHQHSANESQHALFKELAEYALDSSLPKSNSGMDAPRSPRRLRKPVPNQIFERSSATTLHDSADFGNDLNTKGISQSMSGHPKVNDWGPEWKRPLVFPKNGKRKTTVEYSDLDRLVEGEFLNDNLIGFYLRFLENRLETFQPKLAQKVYFFNTFFFASLTNTPRGKKGFNYHAVEKWTRSVNIFAYDYVVIPINETAHWYVAIICNLPALTSNKSLSRDSDKDEASSETTKATLNRDFNCLQNSSANPNPSPKLALSRNDEANQQVDSSDEQATTLSFAEMTLEMDPSTMERTPCEQYTVHEGLDIGETNGIGVKSIGVELNENLTDSVEAQVRELEDVDNHRGKDEQIQNAKSQLQVSPTARKKQKRKSNPPPITRRNPTSPIILTFDSLGIAHSTTVRVLKDYLREEGKAKRGISWEDSSIKGITAKEIPLQDNFCDCGLFLLGYIEKFLENPEEFISNIVTRQYSIDRDWPRLNPSSLRVTIRKKVMDLYAIQQDEKRENTKHSQSKQHSVNQLKCTQNPSVISQGNNFSTAPQISTFFDKPSRQDSLHNRTKEHSSHPLGDEREAAMPNRQHFDGNTFEQSSENFSPLENPNKPERRNSTELLPQTLMETPVNREETKHVQATTPDLPTVVPESPKAISVPRDPSINEMDRLLHSGADVPFISLDSQPEPDNGKAHHQTQRIKDQSTDNSPGTEHLRKPDTLSPQKFYGIQDSQSSDQDEISSFEEMRAKQPSSHASEEPNARTTEEPPVKRRKELGNSYTKSMPRRSMGRHLDQPRRSHHREQVFAVAIPVNKDRARHIVEID